MSVSVNTSLTASTRNALEANLAEATRASIAMATGEAITHAYEDPTGLAIGSNMKSQRDILSVVGTGIEQSQSMLYIAEDGLKSAQKVVDQMETILARAKLGYMTDKLVYDTLRPAYIEMQEEFNRIADSVDFNGQKLLNGTGGVVTAGVVSKIDTASVVYDMVDAVSNFAAFPNTTTAICTFTATTIDNATPAKTTTGTITVKASSNSVKPEVSGGTLTKSGTSFILSNAKLTIKGASITDTDTPPNSATADLVISNVTLTFAGTSTMSSNGVLTFAAAPTVSGVTTNNMSFTNIKSGTAPSGIVSINSITAAPTTVTLTAGSISGIDSEYTSTGGQGTVSTFKFVTGTDLAKDVIKVDMPNLSLADKTGAPGAISTLNIQGLQSSVAPTGLTELTTIADADTDIPIVAALREEVVIFRNALGAYQLRFINLSDQLTTSVEQLDSAQGAILNADLPKNAEAAARAKVNINIAIASLNELNQILSSLQKIVTG